MKSQPLPIYFMILCLTLSLTATSCAKRSQDKLTSELLPVVDSPLGGGHVVLFSMNPMWRGETHGSYFLVFNALLHWDHLDAGGR